MNYTTSPAFTLTSSRKKNILQMTDQDFASPGPIYDVMSATGLSKHTGCKIGNSRRTKINHWVQDTPSPSHYNPEKTSKQQTISIPQYQPVPQPNNVPEGGWYNPSAKLTRPQTANYTMGSRYCSIMDDVKPYPGPASYQTNCSSLARTKSAKNIGFTTSKRFSEANNQPGVGDYQVTQRDGMINNRGSIGKGERQAIKKPDYPSPDAYTKVSFFDDSIKRKMGKSMSAKFKGCFDTKNETAEAFLKYRQTDAHLRKSEHYTIPNTKRKVFEGNSEHPGPADYITNQYSSKNAVNVPFYLQKYSEHNQAAAFPGPGAYQAPSTSSQTKFTIARAKSATRFQDHPGVGRYNVDSKDQSKANLFGKSQRTNFISKNIAGVGDYKIQESRTYKGTIGKSQRFKKEEKLPGPGDYHIQSIIGYKSKHL